MKRYCYATFLQFFIFATFVFAQEPVSSDWTQPTSIPDRGGSATGNVGNNLAILSTGRLVLIYNETDSNGAIKLYQTVSDDDGQSWSQPTIFSPVSGLIGACCVTVAVDKNDVLHAVFTAKSPEEGLYYTKSTDGGQTWSEARRISATIRHQISYHFISTDARGRLHVFWHDGNTDDDTMPAEVMYTRSLDQGATWSLPEMLSKDDGKHSAFPRADFAPTTSDTLLIAWRDARPSGDDWDIYGAISTDGGATWQERLIAGGSGRQWDPMVQIDQHGTIHLGVMEYPAGHQIDVFVWYTRSTDGGETWSSPQTMREARTIFPVFTYDATHDILWYFLRIESAPGSNATSDLGVRYTLDGGETWSDLERLTALEQGGTKFPAFVTGVDGIVRVVYSLKDDAGNDKLYFQKRRSVPGQPAEQEPETFFVVHCEPQTPHLFPQLIRLVDIANRFDIPLTIEFAPQWVEMILADPQKEQRVRTWQQQGHEIAAHHHSVYHLNWDGFTNYPDSVIQALGKMDEFRGNMDAYRAVVEPIAGDSLLLTMGGPGLSDPDSSVDWQPDFLYRTGGGREPVRAFSSPRVVGMGDYNACQVDYFFIDDQATVNALKEQYNATPDKDVVGATTHVFNFVPDSTYLIDWFQFIQNTRTKTVRQIMQDHGCKPDTILTGIQDALTALPKTFRLYQNYPNPFNPETTIIYEVPENMLVNLTIYNVQGRRIKTLVNAEHRPGKYSINWDGRDERGLRVATGVYFYQIRFGTRGVVTKKLLLLK